MLDVQDGDRHRLWELPGGREGSLEEAALWQAFQRWADRIPGGEDGAGKAEADPKSLAPGPVSRAFRGSSRNWQIRARRSELWPQDLRIEALTPAPQNV